MINSFDQCTGCTACKNICPKQCIEMYTNKEGFLYPKVDKNLCVNCNLCENICPIFLKNDKLYKTKAYAVLNNNEQVRKESTSGGFFSILAEYVLEKQGVVYGAAFNSKFEVEHIKVSDKSNLSRLRGAKYSQSKLRNTFIDIKKILKSNNLVLFSGTPCQVAGLKAFLQDDYDNLITVDLICHGVPSPKVWKDYVNLRACKDNDGLFPKSINLRSKISGWSRYNYSVVFDYDRHQYIKRNNEDYFLLGFVNNLYLRLSCYNCNFKGEKRDSDFTLGDYWGVWDQNPEFDDNKGTSLVLVQSDKGNSLFETLNKNFKYLEVDIKEGLEQNLSASFSSAMNKNREIFFRNYSKENLDTYIYDLLFETNKSSILEKLKIKFKKIVK